MQVPHPQKRSKELNQYKRKKHRRQQIKKKKLELRERERENNEEILYCWRYKKPSTACLGKKSLRVHQNKRRNKDFSSHIVFYVHLCKKKGNDNKVYILSLSPSTVFVAYCLSLSLSSLLIEVSHLRCNNDFSPRGNDRKHNNQSK